MNKRELAVERFGKGYNCGQSVFSVFAEEHGLDYTTAMKLTSGIGGGFQMGDICGAASGAALAVGLAKGPSDPENAEEKSRFTALIAEMMADFVKENENLRCEDLLNCDAETKRTMSKEEVYAKHKPLCNKLVEYAVTLAEEYIAK